MTDLLDDGPSAEISPCGKYRYRLTRGSAPRLPFIMLNPSTADALLDDPTIRRCLSFAKREGFNGIEVLNLYSFRATNPSKLLSAEDPFGPDNVAYLVKLADLSGAAVDKRVVCAWGANAKPAHADLCRAVLVNRGAEPVCFGTTKDGYPRHPLYVRGDTPLIPYGA